MSFISRKQLEIHHSKSYEVKEKLKQLGCEWDGVVRAWIAPSLEVKELCLEILNNAEDKDNFRRPFFGWEESPKTFEEAMGWDTKEECLDPLPSVLHTPTKEEVQKICGEENVTRYWHNQVPEEAAAILASGETEHSIYDRLEIAGWQSRQVSLLIDVVRYFREHPPIPALDEITANPPIFSNSSVDPIEMDGTIGVICDGEGTPVAFTVKFPYSHQMVNRVKWMPGRKWNPGKKRWEVPLDSNHGGDVLQNFPHFQRSPKALEIEQGRSL